MKKKVEIIVSNFPSTFKYDINHFISQQGITVLDIQYQFSVNSRDPIYTAMIVYEEIGW